jgi:hypothetical protein
VLTARSIKQWDKQAFAVQFNVKVQQSHHSPGQALRVPAGWGSQISRQSAHEGGKVVSLTHQPPLSPGRFPATHFYWRLSQPQGHSAAGGLCQCKIPVTPSGIEPATFRPVEQYLNQLRHRVPRFKVLHWNFKGETEENSKTHGHGSRSSGRGRKPVHREYETPSGRRYLVQQCVTEIDRQTDRGGIWCSSVQQTARQLIPLLFIHCYVP